MQFLTPAKVGLLALIGLYCDEAIPTASAVPILSFLVAQILPRSLADHSIDSERNEEDNSPETDESSFNSEWEVFNRSNRLKGTFDTITVLDFEGLLSGHVAVAGLPGRTLWDLFLTGVWGIDSLDELHQFIDRTGNLLVRTREEVYRDNQLGIPSPGPEVILLSRTSPLGTFVRRAQLEFARLKFHDASNFWRSFVAWRQISLSTWRTRNAHAGHWSFDVVLDEGDEEWGDDALETFAAVAYRDVFTGRSDTEGWVGTDDVEDLLEFQIEQMQKLGSRVPDTFQDQIRGVLNDNVMIPSASHYVNFLDAWRAGDYTTSFDNLHRYFDYTMQNKDRTFYQYALLNMAVLQADFGCFQEAVTAMQETVSVARENKDMGCLNFSLSWLYHFGKAHPDVINETEQSNMLGVEREGLVFLRTKAKESGMFSLWSSALLSEAKVGLSSGESLATAFENILRSSHLSVTKNLLNNIGSQMMLQSAVWSRLGIAHLASSYCEIFLRCHADQAPFDDILKFTCRDAYLLAEKGEYSASMDKLSSLSTNSLRSLKAHQYHLLFRGILSLKRDLHHNNQSGADQLLDQLLQCRDVDPDLSFELSRLHIEALTRRADYPSALAALETLSAQFTQRIDDVYCRVRLLIMKANLLNHSGRPQRAFSAAVRAATIAWRARLLSALWPAMGAIANILTSLHEFSAAAQILHSVTPRALECEDSELSASLFSLLVDAHMGMAGQAEEGSLARMESLNKALGFVDRAAGEWERVGDGVGRCEMLAKKAVVLRLVGDVALADGCVNAYLALRREMNAEGGDGL